MAFCAMAQNICATEQNICAMEQNICAMEQNICATEQNICAMKQNICTMKQNICAMAQNNCAMAQKPVPIKKNGAKRAKKRGGIYQQHSLRSLIACSIRSTSKVNRSECFNTIFLLRFMFRILEGEDNKKINSVCQ